mgnify:CR=1 FL=1
MNKISTTLLSLCLMCTASLSFAMEPMDKHEAMEKGAMAKDTMKKEPAASEGAMMMKAKPKKMEKQNDKMEKDGSMAMEPKK